MTSPADRGCEESLARIQRNTGQPLVELFAKRGRSRTARWELGLTSGQLREERGWAVRAGDDVGSFFACGTGVVSEGGPWPPVSDRALRLPGRQGEPNLPSAEAEAPVLGESEAVAVLQAVAGELVRELEGAELVQGVLDDGFAETDLVNSRGLSARHRARVASIRLWARLGAHQTRIETADRHARNLSAPALARRLADRLSIASSGVVADRDRADAVLAPEVAALVLRSLGFLWVQAAAGRFTAAARGQATSGPAEPASSESPRRELERRAERWIGSDGLLASEALTVIDDGRLAGGLHEAPFDGEGAPTARIVLVDGGRFVQPLVPWWESGDGIASGCNLRSSWRDLPRPGATHLFIDPDPKCSVVTLLQQMPRGYYFIDALSPVRLDFEADLLTMVVCGFAVRSGRPSQPLARAVVTSSIGGFLRSVGAVGRDLRFATRSGHWGAPSLLVRGLSIG